MSDRPEHLLAQTIDKRAEYVAHRVLEDAFHLLVETGDPRQVLEAIEVSTRRVQQELNDLKELSKHQDLGGPALDIWGPGINKE
jgi:hypothetical protein